MGPACLSVAGEKDTAAEESGAPPPEPPPPEPPEPAEPTEGEWGDKHPKTKGRVPVSSRTGGDKGGCGQTALRQLAVTSCVPAPAGPSTDGD